jgi:hypothetical protein
VAFILAHDTNITKSQLPTKGTLKDMDNNAQADNIEAKNNLVHKITLTKDDTILPLTLLNDMAWVMYITKLFDVKRMVNTMTEVSLNDKEKADLL